MKPAATSSSQPAVRSGAPAWRRRLPWFGAAALVALIVAYRRAMDAVPALPRTRPAHWRPLIVVAAAAMLVGCATALPASEGYIGSRAVRNFAFRSVVHSLALGLLFAWLRGLQLERQERRRRAESNG